MPKPSMKTGSVTVTVPNKAQTMRELKGQGLSPKNINTGSWITTLLLVCAVVMYLKVVKK